MSTESNILLHKEATDLHAELLHCADVALNQDHNKEVAEFYSKMCDRVAEVLAEITKP